MRHLAFETLRIAVLAALCLCGAAVRADDLPMPDGPVLLTVTGAVPVTNSGDAALFDRAMLEALGAEDVATSTIWTDGVQTFTGVPLRALMARLGVTDGSLTATAINDYAVEIPLADAEEGSALVAYARNGRAMSVRDKGPLWIVYPYDSDTKYQSEVYYSRSIWQLDRLKIVAED